MQALALIVGAGDGLSAALARSFARDGGYRIVLASRHPERVAALAAELGATASSSLARCDAISMPWPRRPGSACRPGRPLPFPQTCSIMRKLHRS